MRDGASTVFLADEPSITEDIIHAKAGQQLVRIPRARHGSRRSRRYNLAARSTVIVSMVSLSYFLSPLISNFQTRHPSRSWLYAFLLSLVVALLTLMTARLQSAPGEHVKTARLQFTRAQFQFALLVLVLYLAACMFTRPSFAQSQIHFALTLVSFLGLTILSFITWLRPLLNQTQVFPQIEELTREEASGVLLIAFGFALTSLSISNWYIEFTLFIVGVTICWSGAFIFVLSAIAISHLLRSYEIDSILDRVLDLPVFRVPNTRVFGTLSARSHRIGVAFSAIAVLVVSLSTFVLGAISLGSTNVR